MEKSKFYLSQEDYDKGISIMVRFCLDFAVVKDGKLLLAKRLINPYKNLWHLPGGMIRKGETIQEASERILVAELGLKPVAQELIGFVEYLDEEIPEKNIKTHSVALVFKTTLEEGELKGSFQAKEINYFSEIPEDTILPLKKFLQQHFAEVLTGSA